MTQDSKKPVHRGRTEKKIEFAASDRVEDMRRIADEFMMEIFDFLPGEYLITDESSIRDFTEFGSSDTSEIWGRIKDAYSIEKSDVPSESFTLDSYGCIGRRIGSNLDAWKHQLSPAALM